MKKLSKIFIVQRDEINNKWWHRLAQVLICGSTIFLLVGVLIAGLSEWRQSSREIGAYEYNRGYEFNDSGSLFGRNNQKPKFLSVADLAKVVAEKKSKNNHQFFYGTLLTFGVAIGWLILLESVIYRAIIYIIYGKNHKTSN